VSVLLATLPDVTAPKSRTLHVLTITPFYPSVENPAQGCFIAEPLRRLSSYAIESRVIAVNPFYRQTFRSCEAACEWQEYYALPGNVGLLTSGTLVSRALRPRVRELQTHCSIDLVHAHAALPCGEAAQSIAAELKVPCVVSVHGLDVFADRQCGVLLGLWAKRRSLAVYQRASRIVCISEEVRQRLPKDLQVKATIVYNGVDVELFSPGRETSSRLRILCVGNLIPTKDHALLLRSFAQVSKFIPEVQLQIIGEGPQRARLQELADSLGIRSNVIFVGRQDRTQVAQAMQACDVFALPSRYEGLGCVYLEAMACGKPVIACSGQGIAEIISDGHNGLLIAAGDERGMAERLLLLLRDPAMRQRLGLGARRTVLQNCTLDHQASALAEIYRECVA